MPEIKIGLIGYFGVGAYSDDLIEGITKRLLLEQRSDLVFDSTILSRTEAASNPEYLNTFDLIIHGGGSLLGKCTYYPIRNIETWVNKVETPLAIFGAGYRYEPDKEPLADEMKRRIETLFCKAEIITVRGWKTIQHLQENDIDVSNISGYADPVIATPAHLREQDRVIVGNVRMIPDEEIQHASTERVHRLMAQCYDWLIDEYKVPLMLVSWKHNIEHDNDVVGAEKVISMMKHGDQVNIIAPKNYREAADIIDHALFYFGQRLHPTIYAATQSIPFVGVEYQFDKTLDWISTMGVDNIIHTKSSTLTDFIDAYHRVETNMCHLKTSIPEKTREIKNTVKRILELI